MALHWPTFLTRTGSAVVFAAVMLVGLLWNEWGFLGLTALISLLCLRDYFRLMEKIDDKPYDKALKVGMYALVLIMIALMCVVWIRTGRIKNINPNVGWTNAFGLIVLPKGIAYWLPVFVVMPVTLLVYAGIFAESSLTQGLKTVAGTFYIIVPTCLLILMRDMHWAWPLILILSIWTNDTMAYLVGSLIGRTPFSSISPKKTWEGTAGGAILTIAGAATWAHFSGTFPIHAVVGVATCAAVFGTLGDLFESKLKRLAGVKDSGTLMPGHGGALDRFDSLLVATPFAFCYLYLTHL